MIEIHILVEAVRPDDFAFARLLDVATIARSRRIGTAGTFNDGDVVDIEDELVRAVEVTNGHITHAAVGTQVNGVLIPVALGAVAAIAANATHTAVATLGRQRPLLEGSEGRSVGVARGAHSHAEVLGSVSGILGAGIEGDAAAQSDLRRHEVVVRIQSLIGLVGIRTGNHIGFGSIVTRTTQVDAAVMIDARIRARNPNITIAISIDVSPALHGVVIEVEVQSGAAVVDVDRLAPSDFAFDFFATVAYIDTTDTPLVHARSGIRPAHVDVDGVVQFASEDDSVLFGVRTIVVAVGTIHSVV